MTIPAEIIDLDQRDSFAAKRREFDLPHGCIYLDGNSLGPLPVSAKQYVMRVVEEQWGADLIQSWNKHDWINLPARVGAKIAPLIGAKASNVICCDSISVNLFKLLAGALKLKEGRRVVLSEAENFPTDLYTVQGLQALLGEKHCQLKTVARDQIEDSLDSSVAVLLLTQVNFRTGEKYDIQALTAAAHKQGVLVIWDLAHSAGAFKIELEQAQADFAVGCGYKYLNGGPGAPSFVYVADRHLNAIEQPLSGWMGHTSPFNFDPEYVAGEGVKRFMSGTPGIISMSALDSALQVFDGVDMAQLQQKSAQLSELFRSLVAAAEELSELVLISPEAPNSRGSQLGYAHPNGYEIAQALIDHQVVVDFRAPDIVRFGFAPLYNSFADVWTAVEELKTIVAHKLYEQPQYQVKSQVT